MTAPTSPPTTEQIRDAWDAIAPRYDQFVTNEDMPFAEEALNRVEIGTGTRFLDVACGSGAVSIPAAGRGAQVTAVDLAPTMIERLNARAQAEGLSNLEGLVMNAQSLELPTTPSTCPPHRTGCRSSRISRAGCARSYGSRSRQAGS